MVSFDDGLQERKIYESSDPDHHKGKTCGQCVRFEKRSNGETRCAMLHYQEDVFDDKPACIEFWDLEEQNKLNDEYDKAVEARREELWAVYANADPVELPIVFDGFGMVPECPVCGEMPYSTEQCHWCGQRFKRTEEIEEYEKPDEVDVSCFGCGGSVIAIRSKYNGHKRYVCPHCGLSVTE